MSPTNSEPRAGSVPASFLASISSSPISRRSMLMGTMGAGALAALAACSSGSSSTTTSAGAGGGVPSGTVSFGSNYSDAVPKTALADIVTAYEAQSNGVTVGVNTVDHNSFQENINNYLQGSPDDVFAWFAGYRMHFFASGGLAGDISDVWGDISGMSDAMKIASTADGQQFFVPFTTYPWAVFYRPSVFAQYGYEVPATMDDYYALATQAKKDGLAPLAFGDKDGWPAMGTFDQLNLRLNGYDFHVSLMAGEEAWTDQKVKNVFDEWRKLLEISQPDSLGRTWQEAAQSLQKNEAATYLLGMFVGQQFEEGADRDDLDFFTFPEMDSTIGTGAIEAPIDGFMMAGNPKNPDGAKDFLKYLSSAPAQDVYVKSDSTVIATNSDADTSGYTALQKKAAEFIGSAENIAQFMDRDTRPDFASTVMIPALQTFIGNPNDVDGLVNSIEAQKKSIFVS